MSTLQNARRKSSHNELLDCLTDGRRRQILRSVGDQSGAVTEREFAERLAATGGDQSGEEDSEAAVERVRIELRHVHLPRLDDADLLCWNRAEETVSSTDHPAYDDPQFQHLLETEAEDWNDVVTCVANERRRTVLSVLESGEDTLPGAELAREVAAREADGEASADAILAVRTGLHHVHLPKLDRAGLIEYDVDSGTVTYRGHPQLPRLATLDLSTA